MAQHDIKKHDRPSSSLSLRVRDSEGQDAFDTLTTYHYRHNVSSRVNRKRDVALPIITCPPGQNYYGSNCVRALNAQAYSISCGYRSGQHGFVFTDNPGSCHNDEICIEVENTLWIREAYCVGRINFVSFIRTQNGQSLRDISAGLHPVTNAVTSVEAVMTATDKKSVISTSSLQISAQSAVKINNVQSWGSLAGGVVQCSHCSSVQLSPVPPATQRIVTNVQLEAGMASGILWLAEVIH